VTVAVAKDPEANPRQSRNRLRCCHFDMQATHLQQ